MAVKSPPRSAVLAPEIKRPQNWEQRVSAAYFRMCGAPQKEAAKAAGVSERTIRYYEAHPSWPDAKEHARERWLVSLDVRARGVLYEDLKPGSGKGELALKVLERTDPKLAPPTIAHELSGRGGAPIEINTIEYTVIEKQDDSGEFYEVEPAKQISPAGEEDEK